MWRFITALLLAAAVMGQTVTLPNSGSLMTGQTKCSIAQNITVTSGTTNPLNFTLTYPDNFFGFVQFDGNRSNTTIFTQSKNWSAISICSLSTATIVNSYTFPIVLNATDATNYTLSPTSITLSVVAMKTLTFNTSLSVQKAGCLSGLTAVLSGAVASTFTAWIGLTGTPLYVYGQSGNSIPFGPLLATTQSYQICSYDNATIGQTISPSITVTGDSSVEVLLNTSFINITIANYPTPNIVVSPTLVQDNSTSQQYLNVTVTSNILGSFLYSVQELATTSPNLINLTLSQIVGYLAIGTKTLQSQNDYLSYLYNSPRSMILGTLPVNSTTTSIIQLTNYFPITTYRICGYYQSPSKTLNSTTISCTSITTPSNETDYIYTVLATFNSAKSAATYSDRQGILCYLEQSVTGYINFITNTYGERCELWYNPSSLFKFTGTVNDQFKDYYYLITNDTSANRTLSVNAFTGLFTAVTGAITDITLINAKIKSGAALSTFVLESPTLEYSDLRDETFVAVWTAPTLTATGGGITIQNSITVPIPNTIKGSVYIGVDITNSTTVPSVQSLMNCKLNSGTSLSSCYRFISVLTATTPAITVDGVLSTTPYQVYVAASNRFPYRPYMVSTSVTPNNITNALVTDYVNFSSTNIVVEKNGGCSSLSSISLSKAVATGSIVITPADATWKAKDTSTSATVINFPLGAGANASATNTSQPYSICSPSSSVVGVYSVPMAIAQTNAGNTAINPTYTFVKGALNVTITAAVTLSLTSVTAPQNGCSQVINATLPFKPTNNVTLVIRANSSTNSTLLTTPTNITFTSSDISKTFAVCPPGTTTVNTILTPMVDVTGTDAALYAVQTSNKSTFTVTIVQAPTSNFNIPATASAGVSMQKGGCTSILTINITAVPTGDVTATLDSSILTANNLYVFVLPSSYTNTFLFTNLASGAQSFKICSYENASTTNNPIQIPITISGTNSSSYGISGGNYFINTNVTAAASPSVTLSAPGYYDGGQGNFQVSSNLQGYYYYSLRQGYYTSDPYNFTYYLNMIANKNYTIQDKADFLTHMYATPRAYYVNNISLVPETTNSLILTGLLPSTNYTICGYYYNVAGTSNTSLGCTTNKTTSNSTYTRYAANFTFNSTLTDIERNNFLCDITSKIGAGATQLLNRAGESCNSTGGATAPSKLWYVYPGVTDIKTTETIFLTVTGNDSISNGIVQPFVNTMFLPNGSLNSTESTYINFLTGGKLLSAYMNGTLDVATSRYSNRTFIVLSPFYNQTGTYVNISNISMNGPGQMFFGVGYVNSTIPSQEQLLNCQDGINTTLINCTRLIVSAGNTTYSHQIAGVSGASQYIIYYMPTNEYLERPVPLYNVANLTVSNNTYAITMPTTISLPAGGCSTVQTATIVPSGTASVYVRVGSGLLSSYGLYLRDQTSNNNVVFSNGATNQTFYLCSNSNTTGTTTIPFDIVGNSSVQYIPNVNSINVTVTADTTSPAIPTISTPVVNNTAAYINVMSNKTGKMDYTFQVGNMTTAPVALTDIEAGVVGTPNNYKVLQSSSDALIHLYGKDRDLRIGTASANAGQNTSLTFTDLKPNTTYTVCSYFTTGGSSPVTTNASCSNMTSPADTWTIYKTLLTFSANQTETQRNALLCGFTDLIGTSSTANASDQYKYIINQRSESCNRTGQKPSNLWYNYFGSTFDNSSQVLYLITVDNSTLSKSQAANFNGLFDSTTNRMVNTLKTLSPLVNNTLNSGVNLGSSLYSPYRDESRVVTIKNITFDNTSSNLYLTNIGINATGGVYFVLQPNTTALPNNEQILNCQDGSGSAAVLCFRALSTTALSNVNLILPSIPNTKNYAVAWVATNEYFITPKPVAGTGYSNATAAISGIRFEFAMLLAAFLAIVLLQ